MRQIRWTVALAAQTGLGMLLKKEESLTPGQRIMLMCISVGLVAVAGESDRTHHCSQLLLLWPASSQLLCLAASVSI
jgi:hypothetical protein